MKENSIEEDIKILESIIKINNDYLKGIENQTINQKEIKAIEQILSEYKRVLKENEILKKEKEQAWEEWNNLEQGSYETEQKLKQQIKKIQKENEELKEERQIVGIPVKNKRDGRIGIVLHQWESGNVAVLESINPRVINTHDSWNTLEIVTDEVKQTQTKCETILVQKIKDKIEEILNNGEYIIIFEGDADFPDEATRIDAQKYIKLEKLQELVEGRK